MQLHKRGAVYYAAYYDARGIRHRQTTHCSDRRAAAAAGARLERAAQGADPGPATHGATIGSILDVWLEHVGELVTAGRRSPATLSYHEYKAGSLIAALEPVGEDGERVRFPVDELDAGAVDALVSRRRADGAGEHTVSKELGTLRCALALAKRRGMWAGDVGAIMPHRFAPEYRPRSRWLTPVELRRVLEALGEDHAARAAFAVATSANLGECRAALRADVTTDQVLVRGTKRATRWRTVPLVCPWQHQLVAFALEHAHGTGGRLFRFDGGYQGALRRACEAAGVPRCSSNDLRRTFAHWARQSGLPRDLVATAMGHLGTAMLDKVYGRLDPGELAQLMRRALGTGTPVGQTNADSSDSPDPSDKRKKRKSSKSGAGGGDRTHKPFRTRDFESISITNLRLPTPRKHRREGIPPDATGTPVGQPIAARRA